MHTDTRGEREAQRQNSSSQQQHQNQHLNGMRVRGRVVRCQRMGRSVRFWFLCEGKKKRERGRKRESTKVFLERCMERVEARQTD